MLLLYHSETVYMTSCLEITKVLGSEREEGIAAQGNLLMALMEGIQRMEQSHTRAGTRGKSHLSQAELVGLRMD